MKNPNKIKSPFLIIEKKYDDGFIIYANAYYGRKYKTEHRNLRDYYKYNLRKKPKNSWDDEAIVEVRQYKSWKKISKRKKQFKNN